MMLKNMEISEIDQIVSIHESSWDKHEISVKLGSGILRSFYRYVLDSQYSFAFVYSENERVVGYATGFFDYQKFNNSFRKMNWISLIAIIIDRFFKKQINWADILNLLIDAKKLRSTKFPKHHLGALGLANEYKGTEAGKKAIQESIGAVLNHLKINGCPGCWGLCDVQNFPMRKYLLKLGFEEIDKIQLIRKKVVLFDKTFL
jgi:hypothetical protein